MNLHRWLQSSQARSSKSFSLNSHANATLTDSTLVSVNSHFFFRSSPWWIPATSRDVAVSVWRCAVGARSPAPPCLPGTTGRSAFRSRLRPSSKHKKVSTRGFPKKSDSLRRHINTALRFTLISCGLRLCFLNRCIFYRRGLSVSLSFLCYFYRDSDGNTDSSKYLLDIFSNCVGF